jgi:hypothetical protein
MKCSKRTTVCLRSSGTLCGVFIALFVLVALLIGSVAFDIYHYSVVKAQLHNATDAGALAGAHDLWTNVNLCSADAFAIAAMNQADGRAVSNASNGTTVQVAVSPPGQNRYGSVRVDAQMKIRHFFAPMFSRYTDIVRCTSIAGTHGNLNEVFADQLFPLALSATASSPTNPIPLSSAKVGDRFKLIINSQSFKNAAFTSLSSDPASGNYIQDAVMQALGLTPVKPGFIPSVTLGDNIKLNNGIVGQKKLASPAELQALTDPSRPPLILPVINGDPAFTQSGTVVGFVGIRITDVTLTQGGGVVETITGILQRPQVDGLSGPIFTNIGTPGSIISLSPGPIQLTR